MPAIHSKDDIMITFSPKLDNKQVEKKAQELEQQDRCHGTSNADLLAMESSKEVKTIFIFILFLKSVDSR